jgi:hypothetical protein
MSIAGGKSTWMQRRQPVYELSKLKYYKECSGLYVSIAKQKSDATRSADAVYNEQQANRR